LAIEASYANAANNEFGDTGSFNPVNTGIFYFYNIQSVGRGVQEFKRKYGNRPLVDNWIISGNSGITKASLNNQNEIVEENNSIKYEVGFYIDQIPTDTIILDSLRSIRSDGYYNLGLIYKEQFKEYALAANNFVNFLKNDPIDNLILPAKYHLYKCYAFFNEDLSNKYKDEIVKEYPDSRYSEIILNPKNVLASVNDEDSPENIYKNAYVCYEDKDYEYALESINEAIDNIKGTEIEPKFELLKAYIIFRLQGEEAFIKKLNEVIIDFPSTEESDHAKLILEKMQNNALENKVEN
jgi:tetratricopeptide (TPR) repeat protein